LAIALRADGHQRSAPTHRHHRLLPHCPPAHFLTAAPSCPRSTVGHELAPPDGRRGPRSKADDALSWYAAGVRHAVYIRKTPL